MRKHLFHIGSYNFDLSERTYIMGILNVTPDSFSDGGQYFSIETAVQHGMQMAQDGADIIDIGGESTRPGADPVTIDEELRRIIPVIEQLVKHVQIPVSIDTMKSEVAEAAIHAGASLVNDVSGLGYDKNMIHIVSKCRVPVVIMHMPGNPKTMQSMTTYDNVITDLSKSLKERCDFAIQNGIAKDNIIIDPGIGFGKTVNDNFKIIHHLQELSSLDYPLLIGVSRKSFIGKTLDLPEERRLCGTAAAVASSILNGAHFIRVHDVAAMSEVVRITDHIKRAA